MKLAQTHLVKDVLLLTLQPLESEDLCVELEALDLVVEEVQTLRAAELALVDEQFAVIAVDTDAIADVAAFRAQVNLNNAGAVLALIIPAKRDVPMLLDMADDAQLTLLRPLDHAPVAMMFRNIAAGKRRSTVLSGAKTRPTFLPRS